MNGHAFLGTALLAASLLVLLSAAGAAAAPAVSIRVEEPAGPPPFGCVVETTVPFAQGSLKPDAVGGLMVTGPGGKPVPMQARVAWAWPDGSVRWLLISFDPVGGPGEYRLAPGPRAEAPPLLRQEVDALVVDTGPLVLRLPSTGPGWLQAILARDAKGGLAEVARADDQADLAITTPDGGRFLSRQAKDQKVVIEENGPVCARVRYEGQCAAADGKPLFDFIARWQAFRGRSQAVLTVTWINRTASQGERVRDMRVRLPYSFAPKGIIVGCEGGVYDSTFVAGNSYWVLQEDQEVYRAQRLHTDGRTLNLATGGGNGKRCPGWLAVEDESRALAVWVPRFWEEYPNELAVRAGEVSVGLWPERANEHLSHKLLLPPHPDAKTRYRHTEYKPILPHPYQAFVDGEQKCLDVPQGVAKTQQIVLDAWGGASDGPHFERKYWKGALLPARGHVAPEAVAASGAVGRLLPVDEAKRPEMERMLRESFEWLERHIGVWDCYGKFDYGDFRYMSPSTAYDTAVGKWAAHGEMPREGYWHNNERDQIRGILLHYLRTGDARAFRLAETAARHALDVDIRHHPYYGMYTHSYGHCYRALGGGGEPDHAWLLGLLEWSCVSGDPVATDWVLRCGDALAGHNPEGFAKADLRTTSLQLHMMVSFWRYTGQEKYLRSARRIAQILQEKQLDSGVWMPYLGDEKKTHYMNMAFANHTILTLADYLDATGDERMLLVLTKSVDAYCNAGPEKWDVGEVGLILPALEVLWQRGHDAATARRAREILEYLARNQCRVDDPRVRGEFWAGWGDNVPEGKKRPGRPPQFVNQVRPLAPGTVLAYGVFGLEPADAPDAR